MRSYSVDKPIIIKAHAVKYFTDPCLAPTPPKPHCPSKIAITPASLVKGRWIGGKEQTLTLLHLLAICPLFYIAYFSAVKTKGLSRHHLSPRTNPFQNRTTPLTFLNANIYMHLYAFTFALSHALFVGRGARPSRCTKPLHSHNLLKSTSTATPRTKIAFLAKGDLLLLGLTEPTMVWIVIV